MGELLKDGVNVYAQNWYSGAYMLSVLDISVIVVCEIKTCLLIV